MCRSEDPQTQRTMAKSARHLGDSAMEVFSATIQHRPGCRPGRADVRRSHSFKLASKACIDLVNDGSQVRSNLSFPIFLRPTVNETGRHGSLCAHFDFQLSLVVVPFQLDVAPHCGYKFRKDSIFSEHGAKEPCSHQGGLRVYLSCPVVVPIWR